jgi:hypothetical protein
MALAEGRDPEEMTERIERHDKFVGPMRAV